MDLLDRFLGHDAWTTRGLLLQSRGLSDEQLDRPFPIGPGSLRATFDHIVWNMEAWTELMKGLPIPTHPGPAATTVPRLIERLDAAAAEFATVARRVQDEGKLDELFADPGESGVVMKTFGAGIVHVITHSMHHRAQVLNMMRQLGMTNLIEGDALTWERTHRPGGWPRSG
jgi:uncharacterized damage-inducible protein DinB